MDTFLHPEFPQVKICGLTKPKEAVKCAELGADAIGLVFFKRSPRYVTREKAKTICDALPETVIKAGVFVDEPFQSLMETVYKCRLTAIQLHGNEPPKLVRDLVAQGMTVIKALYVESRPSIAQVDVYDASAYLVECAAGDLPGGNAMAWDWSDAAAFGKSHPMVLAGGLSPENVAHAIHNAMPDAVDVSSGVENAPGQKDMYRVKQFITAVRQSAPERELRRIFK
jgi:phosphoribosylanthranilate isomerase